MSAAADPVTAPPLSTDFERIFRENYALVYRAAYSVLGNAEDAEDVLQTLFVRLLRREMPPDFEKNPKGYLYRSAVNISLDITRSRRPVVPESEAEVISATAAGGRSAEIQEWLRRALQRLNAKEAQMFILHHIEGYTTAEIGALLGTSRGTVAVSLFRARSYLRKSLRRHFGDSL